MRALWLRCRDERGTVLILSLFIMTMLMVAGAFLLKMSTTETDISYNTIWSEGTFYAADAAIAVGMDRLSPALTTASVVAPATIGGRYTYQGNVGFVGTTSQPGFSLGTGTGYNPGGFVFYTYALTGTGTGPRTAQRQLQAQASYGPVAQ